eukprot:4602551-Pleurochrysis_carterae.AAC.1
MGKQSREVIDRGDNNTGFISETFTRGSGVSGGAPSVWLELARRSGSMADRTNREVGKGGEDVKPAPGLHPAHLLLL